VLATAGVLVASGRKGLAMSGRGAYSAVVRIGLWIVADDLQGLVGQAQEAREVGFPSVWSGQVFGLDTLTAFAAAGAEVDGLDWGTAVVPTFPRHPAALAMQALTANAALGGRLTLGVGPSHQVVIEQIFGLDYSAPAAHVEEYLRILVPLVREGKVSVDGARLSAHLTLSSSDGLGLPVLVSALGPKMLRLAGQLADGTVTWMTGPRTVADHVVPSITRAAAEAGRPAPRVVVALPVAVTGDPGSARARAAEVFAVYGGLPAYRAVLDREGAQGPADVALVGSASEIASRLAILEEAGVAEFVAVCFTERRRTVEAIAALR
jgi:F420-dependent oxidoreductase-like protein